MFILLLNMLSRPVYTLHSLHVLWHSWFGSFWWASRPCFCFMYYRKPIPGSLEAFVSIPRAWLFFDLMWNRFDGLDDGRFRFSIACRYALVIRILPYHNLSSSQLPRLSLISPTLYCVERGSENSIQVWYVRYLFPIKEQCDDVGTVGLQYRNCAAEFTMSKSSRRTSVANVSDISS
jgi:hypothetical protein